MLLLDQGLRRTTVLRLRELGLDAEHVGDSGLAAADDRTILDRARQRRQIVATLDADFHAQLALSRAAAPSVIRIRIEGLKAERLATLLRSVLERCGDDLRSGAMVTVTESGVRVRRLPLSTADIRALFFRNFSPDLELRVVPHQGILRFSLYNKGRGVAKFPSLLIGLTPDVGGQWFDGEGNPPPFKTGWMEFNRPGPYGFQFMANANVVVHPEQDFCILTGPVQFSPRPTRISKIIYRLFAENMVPKEDTVDLMSNSL